MMITIVRVILDNNKEIPEQPSAQEFAGLHRICGNIEGAGKYPLPSNELFEVCICLGYTGERSAQKKTTESELR
jgi:hypothetical protein